MSEYLLPIIIIAVLVAINGVFVAAEFCLRSARGAAVWKRSPKKPAAVAGGLGPGGGYSIAKEGRQEKGATSPSPQLGITLASIGLGMYGEPAVAAWLYPTLESLGDEFMISRT